MSPMRPPRLSAGAGLALNANAVLKGRLRRGLAKVPGAVLPGRPAVDVIALQRRYRNPTRTDPAATLGSTSALGVCYTSDAGSGRRRMQRRATLRLLPPHPSGPSEGTPAPQSRDTLQPFPRRPDHAPDHHDRHPALHGEISSISTAWYFTCYTVELPSSDLLSKGSPDLHGVSRESKWPSPAQYGYILLRTLRRALAGHPFRTDPSLTCNTSGLLQFPPSVFNECPILATESETVLDFLRNTP